MDFLGFEMIFMGILWDFVWGSFFGGYSCEVFWGGSSQEPFHRGCHILEPPGRGLVHPSFFSGLTLQKSHVNHWGYNPLTIRGMSHQV